MNFFDFNKLNYNKIFLKNIYIIKFCYPSKNYLFSILNKIKIITHFF